MSEHRNCIATRLTNSVLHAGSCELEWAPAEMPLAFADAPTLVETAGHADIPALLDEIAGVARHTLVAQFASKFRSRRKPLANAVAREVEEAMQAASVNCAARTTHYVECLPFPPPRVDHHRHGTSQELLRLTLGEAPASRPMTRC